DLAVDIVVAADETDVLDLGADLEGLRGPFHLEVLDDDDRVAVGQNRSVRIAHDLALVGGFGRRRWRPLVGALGTDQQRPVLVGEGRIAGGTGRQRAHGRPASNARCAAPCALEPRLPMGSAGRQREAYSAATPAAARLSLVGSGRSSWAPSISTSPARSSDVR